MDRMVPGMDGLSVVISALRAAAVRTPILILSALGQLDERVKGLRAGGDDYLTKPFGFLGTVGAAGEPDAPPQRAPRWRPSSLRRPASIGPPDPPGDAAQGRALDLLPREFKLLEHLLRQQGPGGHPHHAARSRSGTIASTRTPA